VVVGDQRGDAVLLGAGDAFQAGDAVVDGDDQVGRLLGGDIDDFRRQAVAELEAVGEQEIDIGAERFQGAHADGGGGGAVAVVVADDQQLRFGLDGIGQQLGGVGGVGQGGRRNQRLQFVVEFGLVGDAACGVEAGEQRVQALLFELPDDARRAAAGDDAGHWVFPWPVPGRWPSERLAPEFPAILAVQRPAQLAVNGGATMLSGAKPPRQSAAARTSRFERLCAAPASPSS
jgi:hypothetical protein